MPCASWRGEARSGAVALCSTIFMAAGARSPARCLRGERGQGGMSRSLLVSRRSWWRAERVWRGVVARERACAPWRALAHGTAARTRLRRVLWTLTRVAASVGSGGEVLGILQTRWSGAGWRLACCPRRGGNGGAALSTIDVLARAGGHGWGTEVLGR